MEKTINIGIDLGTTNSAIGKYENGDVKIFKNPISWKETMPSVVAFRRNKILTGEKAREYLSKDPNNVFGTFKRKIGTSELFYINSLKENKNPIELSAQILRELKNFIQPPEKNPAAVITIPASFDTIQSNATKKAGYKAGFSEVVLLQEPIAASLAYANQMKNIESSKIYWLVYDLGGGTFDVALVKNNENEMRIIDHEGDNFLGGKDFDSLIIEKIIIPYLCEKYPLKNFEQELKSASGKYNKLWYILMKKAEEAKLELTQNKSSEIEIELTDDEDNFIEEIIEISRQKFEEIISSKIDYTIEMIKKILKKNNLKSQDIDFMIMVGGSSYIPFVRKTVEKKLNIRANCEIDPTTAVTIGAAYYAGTRLKKSVKTEIKKENPPFEIKVAYEKTSKEKEVFFTAKFKGNIESITYKIIRSDGNFDSGLKKLKEQISEELPLVEEEYNIFYLKIYDKKMCEIPTNIGMIGISQGKYSIAGQPLPEDICLEVDDPVRSETKLLLIFQKNSILSIKKNITRLLNKTIRKNTDDRFIINVLEGSAKAVPEANKTIGYMEIKGSQLNRDLIRGADIELTVEISESRDLKIVAYIPMLDQEFSQIFTPTQRHIPIKQLKNDIKNLEDKIDMELQEMVETENYELAQEINQLKTNLSELNTESEIITNDDITDKRYQLEDKKRSLALDFYNCLKNNKINNLVNAYFKEKHNCKVIIEGSGGEAEEKRFEKITYKDREVVENKNIREIRQKTDDLSELRYSLLWKMPDFLINVFEWLKTQTNDFDDLQKGESLIESGYKALEKDNYTWLKQINLNLINLLPKEAKNEVMKRATGLI